MKTINKNREAFSSVNMRMTKTSSLIVNVIGPDLKSQYIEDLKDTKYLLLCDESTGTYYLFI